MIVPKKCTMKKTLHLFAAALLACIVPGTYAKNGTPTSAAVARWIADLDSTHFKTRERASKELLALKEAALEPLKDALRNTKRTLEQRRRIERLLSEVRVYGREGEPYKGLRLVLRAYPKTGLV